MSGNVEGDQLGLGIQPLVHSLEISEARARRLLHLRRLDARPLDIVRAQAPAPWQHDTSYSSPRPFVCTDGRVRWLKPKAQQGLAVEVICGRLAARVGAGPAASPVWVGHEAIGAELGLDRFKGHVVGIDHLDDVESSKKLLRLLGSIASPGILPVDDFSRAMTIAFQTWLGLGDEQLLVNLKTGELWSADHGEAFADLRKGPPSQLVIARLPGIVNQLGMAAGHLDAAIARIEDLSDADLLEAVSCIPDEPGWRALFDRRLAIAEWLIKRRGRLREVLLGWGSRPS